MNIHFVSIPRSIRPYPLQTGEQVYEAVGRNTGNLLFTDAVWSQISWDSAQSGYSFDPAQVNDWADAVVIPAANWLRSGVDFSDLAQRVELLEVPVILLGVGAQADDEAAIPDLPESVVRLMRAVASKSAVIGTRGLYSSLVLSRYGIHNSVVIGCPSLFAEIEERPELQMPRRVERILVGGTRYGLPRKEPVGRDLAQRGLYRWAFAAEHDLCYQSERPELDALVSMSAGGEASEWVSDELVDYYDAPGRSEMHDYLRQHGHLFVDPAVWHTNLRRYDLYVGSRIHGAIAALVVGTPALLLTHDSRTAELATTASIPSAPIDAVEAWQVDDWSKVVSPVMLAAFEMRRAELRKRYVAALEANGLQHRL